MKMFSKLFLCLKDCIDNKPEQLAQNMNGFLLFKNEISLQFLRKQDNIVALLKCAIKRMSSLLTENDRKKRPNFEAEELAKVETMIEEAKAANRHVNQADLPEH